MSRKASNGEQLPNPRQLSDMLHGAVDERESKVNHMFTQWGQYIIHDIVHTPELNVTCDCESNDLGVVIKRAYCLSSKLFKFPGRNLLYPPVKTLVLTLTSRAMTKAIKSALL